MSSPALSVLLQKYAKIISCADCQVSAAIHFICSRFRFPCCSARSTSHAGASACDTFVQWRQFSLNGLITFALLTVLGGRDDEGQRYSDQCEY
jgi:hypothetical protein